MDHRGFLLNLAIENGWQRGIELGLGTGKLIHGLLAHTSMAMVGVDLGVRPDRRIMLEEIQKSFPLRCKIHFKSTTEAAQLVPDHWADFIFIDAAHSYEAVASDIKLWAHKIKPHGWFGGHDYHPKFPGVIRAVQEAYPDSFEVLDHFIWKANTRRTANA